MDVMIGAQVLISGRAELTCCLIQKTVSPHAACVSRWWGGIGMDLGLGGKIGVVAGGSRGLGRAIAHALAHEGADLAIVARDVDVADRTCVEISAATGRTVRSYGADVGKADSVRDAVARIAEDFGGIDILVNSAGKPADAKGPTGIGRISEADFLADVNIKVFGYFRMMREVAMVMMRRKSGRIVNIGGLSARQTGSTVASIRCVSVAAMTKNAAAEYGPHGIHVNCLHPGMTRTEKTDDILRDFAEAAGCTVEEMERRVAASNLLGRLVTAEEIGGLVAFLASARSIAVNGESIGAGGGVPMAIHY